MDLIDAKLCSHGLWKVNMQITFKLNVSRMTRSLVTFTERKRLSMTEAGLKLAVDFAVTRKSALLFGSQHWLDKSF